MTWRIHPSRTKAAWVRTVHLPIRSARISLKRELVELLGGQCIDCGYKDHLAALDFDHKDPRCKTHTISSMLCKWYPKAVILEEVAKCELRCANCHRVKTNPEYN